MSRDVKSRLLDLVEECERRKAAGEEVAPEELAEGDAELAAALRSALWALSLGDRMTAPTVDTSKLAHEATAGGMLVPSSDDPARPGTVAVSFSVEAALARLSVARLEKALSRARDWSSTVDSADGAGLTAKLVEQGLLTKFQLERIANDQAESLTLGGYSLLDELGEGGMGQVFRARHLAMNRIVAIKVLPPTALRSAEAVARFRREVQAAAHLIHPNVVCAYDAGEQGGRHFLAMEYVKGEDLAARVRRSGPLSFAEALALISDAAKGLEYAHGQGMVHRDIKPGNLLLSESGELKILDFGLARFAAAESSPAEADLTATHTVMGTVDFMAPEQATDAHGADARADVYSLGCTLFFLVAGRAPYGGNTLMARLVAHREKPIPTIRDAAPDASSEFDAAFRRMLAKRPDERPPSMRDVREAIETERERLARAAAAAATTEPATKRGRSWLRGALAGGSFASLGLLLALAAFALFKIRTPHGTIVLEVNERGAVVEVFDGQRVEIVRKSGEEKLTISVDPGKKRLRVTKEGFEIFVREFVLGDGDARPIVARLEPLPAVASTQNSEETTASVESIPAPSPDRERAAAEWALSIGGYVQVKTESRHFPTVTKPEGLPEEAFELRNVNLDSDRRLQADDFAKFVGLAKLNSLFLSGNELDPSAIGPIGQIRTLGHLQIMGDVASVNSSELAPLNGLPALTHFAIGRSQVNDDWAFLKGLSTLAELRIDAASADDLRRICEVSSSIRTIVSYGPVDVATVEELQRTRQRLRVVRRENGRHFAVGADPVTEFASRIKSRGGEVTVRRYDDDSSTTDLNVEPFNIIFLGLSGIELSDDDLNDLALTSLRYASADGSTQADVLARAFAERPEVQEIELRESNLTDAGLASLAQAPLLNRLDVRGTKVTAAGIKEFRRSHPDCWVDCDFQGADLK